MAFIDGGREYSKNSAIMHRGNFQSFNSSSKEGPLSSCLRILNPNEKALAVKNLKNTPIVGHVFSTIVTVFR